MGVLFNMASAPSRVSHAWRKIQQKGTESVWELEMNACALFPKLSIILVWDDNDDACKATLCCNDRSQVELPCKKSSLGTVQQQVWNEALTMLDNAATEMRKYVRHSRSERPAVVEDNTEQLFLR